ncbi:uncharacterized protein LOC106159079 [Lingula anatina]|uniref:Uncharacterized protein LOC106159079 n=1 Tax=Lingula anatina TaxID=7574 RepID=A0A1S3HXH5_LINAN|nr:uncharacterized protein LOC106159079 [Lingula anatina]|eukprot:XP_013390713.1 uncharacterized protein LOC106159079 [Lingula anatina]
MASTASQQLTRWLPLLLLVLRLELLVRIYTHMYHSGPVFIEDSHYDNNKGFGDKHHHVTKNLTEEDIHLDMIYSLPGFGDQNHQMKKNLTEEHIHLDMMCSLPGFGDQHMVKNLTEEHIHVDMALSLPGEYLLTNEIATPYPCLCSKYPADQYTDTDDRYGFCNKTNIATGVVIWGHLMKECDALFRHDICYIDMDYKVQHFPAEPPFFPPPPKPTPPADYPWVCTVVIGGAVVVMVLVGIVAIFFLVYERRKRGNEEGDQEGLWEARGDENDDTDGQEQPTEDDQPCANLAQPWEDDQPCANLAQPWEDGQLCANQQELLQEEQEQPETEARGPVHNTTDDDRNRPSEETGDETHAKVCAGTTFDHSDLTQTTGEEEEDGATHYKSLAGDEATPQTGTRDESIAKHGQQEAASVVKGGQQVTSLVNAQHSSESSVSQDVEAEMEEESDITEQD